MMEQSTNEQKCIDLLNRQPFIDRLKYIADLLSKGKKNACYAINGEWGSGKSFVLDMFEKEIAEIETDNGSDYRYMLFHYNCWQYDYYDEPLIAIVAAMQDCVAEEKNYGITDEAKAKLAGAVKSIAQNLVGSFSDQIKTKLGFNLVSIIKNGIEGYKEGTEKWEENHSYDPYFQFKDTIRKLRESVAEFANERTIVFVVDELDRCMPEYAIKVLERLHHVFDEIENVQVILAVDKEQLGHTVQQIFGENTSVKQYLDKFIDFELKLSTGESTNFVKNTCPEYFACFTNAHMKADEIDFFISFLFNGLDMRSRRLITEKSFLCHRMLDNNGQTMTASRLCVELLVSLLCHFQFSIIETKKVFNYKDIFNSIMLRDAKGYNSGLTDLSLIYSEERKIKYLFTECDITYINTRDIFGYILGCYRHILGFRDDVWINMPPTEYKGYDKELETKYFSDFWKFIQAIS